MADRRRLFPGRDPLADPEALIQRVYSYVAYRMGDGPDAEDVTSEAMARAVRYRESFDPSKGPPAAWVVGIARRCIDDAYARPRHEPDPPDADSGRDVEAETLDRLTVRAAVAQLPDRDRELVALRYGADLSARQIGEHLDMKTNAVEVALHRALKRLETFLDEPDPGESSPVRVSPQRR
jgi:RNA polymerase sigma factor (sigma-70 family)